jgi:hypothetical protein
MSRKIHPSSGFRRQRQKSKGSRGDVFAAFRPLGEESAEHLYELMKELKGDGVLPENALLREPKAMRVTYLEKRKLTRELHGYAQGFNSWEAIHRINNECRETRHIPIVASLGRVSLMDRRDDTVIARLDHNQIIASEYSVITDALRSLHVHIRGQFKPHVSLVRLPGVEVETKRSIAREVQEVIPEDVVLDPMLVEPPLSRQRG